MIRSRLRSLASIARQRARAAFSPLLGRRRGRAAKSAPAATTTPLDPEQAARNLIAAIDAGGIPLNTARVNQIARALGLEVAASARPAETIERLRDALRRIEARMRDPD